MQTYDLSLMVTVPPRYREPIVTGIGIEVPLGIELQYLRELRRVIRSLHGVVRTDIVPRYERKLTADRVILDEDVELSWFETLAQLAGSLVTSIFGMGGRLRNVIWHQVEKHTGSFIGTIRRGFGVDVSPMVRATDMLANFETFIRKQQVEVMGLTDDLLTRVRRVVIAGAASLTPVDVIRRQLREQFEAVDRRAQGLARNEVANANTALTEARHTQAKIDEYKWRTRKDERVRPLHARLEGRIYKQGEPTGAERGLPPGEPYGCRCIEVPIIRLPYRR